jgi:competence protein ComEC
LKTEIIINTKHNFSGVEIDLEEAGKLKSSTVYSVSFLGGIVLSSLFNLPIWIWGILIGLLSVFLVFYSKNKFPLKLGNFSIIFCLVILLFGGLRFSLENRKLTNQKVGFYNDQDWQTHLSGTISSYVIQKENYQQFILTVDSLTHPQNKLNNLSVSGKVLIRTSNKYKLGVGDIVLVVGPMYSPSSDEGSTYIKYLASRDVFSLMPYSEIEKIDPMTSFLSKRTLGSIRNQAERNLYRLFPAQTASLLSGIVLGMDEGISESLQSKFQQTGMTHIIAISGFNISVIGLSIFAIFQGLFGTNWARVFSLLGIFSFVILVGAEPSVMRAAIMAVIVLFANQIGRKVDGVGVIFVTASLMAFWNPRILWDIGFQLSFVSTLGIIFYYPLLEKWFYQKNIIDEAGDSINPKFKSIVDIILITISAQITTIPILLYYFHQYSLLSIPANILILPVQPILLISSIGLVIVSFVYFPFADWLSPIIWIFPKYTINMVEWISKWKLSSFIVPKVGTRIIGLYYLIIFSVKKWMKYLQENYNSNWVRLTIIPLMLAVIIIWERVNSLPDQIMDVFVMDVGNGLGVIIQTPDKRNILLNGGRSGSQILDSLSSELPYFNHDIDLMINSDTSYYYAGGMSSVISYFPPQSFVFLGESNSTTTYKNLVSVLFENNVPISEIRNKEMVELADNLLIQYVFNSEGFEYLLLTYENFRIMIVLQNHQEQRAVNIPNNVNLLIMSDAGYENIIRPEVLDQLSPKLIILSTQAGEIENIPDRDFLQSIDQYTMVRTDQAGWVRIQTDGKRMWVYSEK